MQQYLSADALRWTLHDEQIDDADLNPQTQDTQHGRPGALGQERAMNALELGLGIKERGFNIFVVGHPGTGRTSTVRQLLLERAAKEPSPNDIILLYNFEDRDRPLSVSVPSGTGPRIKKLYEAFVDKMLVELERAFDSDTYNDQRQQLEKERQEKSDEMLSDVEKRAKKQGFILTRNGTAISLSVAGEDGNPITEEQFVSLPPKDRAKLESRAEELHDQLEDAMRRVRAVERKSDEDLEKFDRDSADAVLRPLIEELKEDLKEHKEFKTDAELEPLLKHIDAIRDDILDRLWRLVPNHPANIEEGQEEGSNGAHKSVSLTDEEDENDDSDEPALLRYRVNVFVTHTGKDGAPVVQETHPTASNLIGRIEHRVRGGETVTDFTRIRAGVLYRANGGYLLINAMDLLRDPTAWEGIKRALKNRQIELDDPGEPGRMVVVASLRPEPVPLAIKVCLVGTPELYYSLQRSDPEFSKLFKIKVDFDVDTERSTLHLQKYVRFLAGLAHEEKLLPLSKSGAARVVEQAVRLCEDQDKLTTRFGDIADLMREANFWASKENADVIARSHVQQALSARADREGFLELHMREDIRKQRVSIETDGAVVGQVNGLTVLDLGSYAFGVPVRITCRVGAGRGEIIDVEREVELGGPLHTKGTMILKGILLDRFGHAVPLCLQATLCMEQNHSEVDGDSASLAETCALFSALAQAPINQRMALTGAIDQRGRVQAVGGVNEKIEGFWRVCADRDQHHLKQYGRLPASEPYEILIPRPNARDLMLDEDVIAACNNGRLRISTVDTLEDALEALTGRSYADGAKSLLNDIAITLKNLASVQAHTARGTWARKGVHQIVMAAKPRSKR